MIAIPDRVRTEHFVESRVMQFAIVTVLKDVLFLCCVADDGPLAAHIRLSIFVPFNFPIAAAGERERETPALQT